MTYTIEQLKPLNLEQYDKCRESALERVKKRIGEKPTRKQFKRELGAVWTLLDILALVVFIPALVISSIHIVSHMGKLAGDGFDQSAQAQAGTIISRDFFVAAHQWAFIPLAEGSMILFLVMFGLQKDGWRRIVYLLLAALAGSFVLIANWQSNIGFLESLLAPAFTIGIGLKLEHLIIQILRRKKEVDERYLEALGIYEAATADPTQHPDFSKLLRQEVWQKLISLKANAVFADAPTGFKVAAVRREQARDSWADEEGVEAVKEFTSEEEKPKAQTPFGNTVPGLGQGDPESMKITARANGHMTENVPA